LFGDCRAGAQIISLKVGHVTSTEFGIRSNLSAAKTTRC